MVNEVAPRPHNSGHFTIETVPYMSQFQAQLHAVLDLPIPQALKPEKPAAIMINILGGADAKSHHRLSRLARTTSKVDMRVYLHLYGKESKPSRKIGHITITGSCSVEELEEQAQPFLKLVDEIREERLKASAEQLRPQEESTSHRASDVAREPEVEPEPPTNGDKVNAQLSPSSEPAQKNQKEHAVPKPEARPASSQRETWVGPPASPRDAGAADQNWNGADKEKPVVLVTMGSDSDLPVLKAGLDILRQFRVPFTTRITSAHRTPKLMMRVAQEAHRQGYKVIIAAAGGAAHLPGMVSSETPLPVIGVPVKASQLDGLDSLLSIVQMPVSSG